MHLRQNCSDSRTVDNLKSWLEDAAGFSSVDFRIVFLVPLTNSMSSLPSRLPLICPNPERSMFDPILCFPILRGLFSDGGVHCFHECAYLSASVASRRESDRGRLDVRTSPLNPYPPAKDYPPLRLADRLFSVKNMSQQRQRAVQNCSLLGLKA